VSAEPNLHSKSGSLYNGAEIFCFSSTFHPSKLLICCTMGANSPRYRPQQLRVSTDLEDSGCMVGRIYFQALDG
jgi:hypothetical protein